MLRLRARPVSPPKHLPYLVQRSIFVLKSTVYTNGNHATVGILLFRFRRVARAG